MSENYMKLTFQCLEIKFYWHIATPILFTLIYGHFSPCNSWSLELSKSCFMAWKAWSMYCLTLYGPMCWSLAFIQRLLALFWLSKWGAAAGGKRVREGRGAQGRRDFGAFLLWLPFFGVFMEWLNQFVEFTPSPRWSSKFKGHSFSVSQPLLSAPPPLAQGCWCPSSRPWELPCPVVSPHPPQPSLL